MGERVDLLEDARHRRQVGRFDLHQLGHDLLGVAAEVGERAAEVEDGELDQQREGVSERQVQIDDLVVGDLAALADHVDDRAVVAVGEHAALRWAGRAGGVDERVGVLGAHGGPARVELLRASASARARGPASSGDRRLKRFGRSSRPSRGLIDHDHGAQVRQLVADRGDLRELLVVLADDRAGAGVGDHPQALLGRVGLVDRHDDGARGGGGQVGIGPLGAGVGEDADALARLDPEVDQPEADLLHDRGELGVGDVVPGAVALEAHGGLARVLGCSVRNQVGDCARPRAWTPWRWPP